MKKEDNVLQEITALSLGPSWTESNYLINSEATYVKRSKSLIPYVIKRKALAIKGIDITLKPATEMMDNLVQSMKRTCITYRFFPIVNFFIKTGQYKIVLTAVKDSSIFSTLGENLPFLKKESAENYLAEKYWDDFFYTEAVELSAPKGAFNVISRCGITGILLGPPNYHLYGDLLREHYELYLKNQYSWETFVGHIKNESDPEIVHQWIDVMSRSYRYYSKQNPDVVFENYAQARQYLLQHISLVRDNVRKVNHVILSREDVNRIVEEDLKQAIEDEIMNEVRVPIKIGYLCSARFRHSGFHVYKKGRDSDKITYVCAIKRRIRDEFTSFSKELEAVIDCIEDHPRESLQSLVQNYVESIKSDACSGNEAFEFKRNVLFLVQQGWVTQYEDGSLYVSPRQTFASKNNQKYA